MAKSARNKIFGAVIFLAAFFAGSAIVGFAQVGGALGNVVSGRSASLAGSNAASISSPLEAMQGNPAGLTELSGRSLDLSVTSLFVTGNFDSKVSSNGSISTFAGMIPYGAVALPLGSRFNLGLAVAPDVLMKADWKYLDPPGGAGGTSYGLQQNKSAIIVLRSSVGIGVSLNRRVSIGGSVGIDYNQNTLHALYIFQQQPTLAGLKTLLDLHTSGTGWNGSFGIFAKPSDKVRIGLSYKTSTGVHAHGDASGNAEAQFTTLGLGFQPDFHYHAETDTKFPQAISGGVAWQASRRARLNVQGSWINWRNAFDRLPVKLTAGDNSDINGLVGSDSLNDFIPLRWRNQAVVGVSLESPIGENIALRGGYSYATNPVPSATLTPLTGAILQNTIGTGAGYRHGRYSFDLGYQAQLPATSRVQQSSLLAGEYSDSRVHVAVQSLTFTTRMHF